MGRASNARQRLLNAASELLWEKSYHAVTVDEICARASVQKGSLYHFFESKRAIVVAALEHFWATLVKPAYEQHFAASDPPLIRITRFLTWLQEWQREKHCHAGKVLGWPLFTLGCELGAREPAIARKLCEMESAELLYFESAIRDAIAQGAIEPCVPRSQALLLRAAMHGTLARARLLNDPEELSALPALSEGGLRLQARWTRNGSRPARQDPH